MVTKTLLETIFPGVIVENFDIVSIQHYPKEEEMHIHLDEKKSIPVEFLPVVLYSMDSHQLRRYRITQSEAMLYISMSAGASGLILRPMRS